MFGNGDCFSAQQYYEEMEMSGVDGIMVARGALIKPWIFTEIKERREWDISATERLEGIRKVSFWSVVVNECLSYDVVCRVCVEPLRRRYPRC